MRNPKPFKFKTHFHCKRRFAKKIIGNDQWKKYIQFHNYKGLISSCNGLNMNPEKIEPDYWYIGKKKILFDIDFSDKFNSCSLRHCISKPKTYQECLDYINHIIDYYSINEDVWKFKERYSGIKLNQDGTIKSIQENGLSKKDIY